MASKSNPNRATSLDKAGKVSPKNSLSMAAQSGSRQKVKLVGGSMGLGLLLVAVGASLVGLGALGYFVYQELISGAQREAGRETAVITQRLESRLGGVRQAANNLAIASRSISQQATKPKNWEPFQGLIVNNLRGDGQIAGLGIVSTGNLLSPPPKPVGVYVWRSGIGLKVEPAGRKLTNELSLSNRVDVVGGDAFKSAMENRSVWLQPYDLFGKQAITYVTPISDASNRVVGAVYADAIAADVFASVSQSGYVIFSNTGNVITADPSFNAQDAAVTGAINTLVQQASAQSVGVAQAGGNIWAYQKIAGSDWVVATYLAEQSILTKVALLLGGAAVGISGILAIAILTFVNSLKKRLAPLVEECDRFLAQQGHALDRTEGNGSKDEIDHLSESLKNTLHYVKTNEMRLRNELAATSEDDISLAQQNTEATELLEAEVGDLLDVVSSMEEGDLTIEAQVNDRATGLVADTLNRLREKLVEIISNVLGTAQQVARGASDLEELAKTVVLNTAEQAQSVVQGQALTEQVAAIAQQSAEQVNMANLSLQEVRDTVADGQVSINTLTESISVLQTGSAQIVQRMKTLGEFVGLAEQFVQDQGQIAYSTQILAQNATLVAARAAEQKDPKQFANVAREFGSIAGQVDDLATRTNDGLTILQQRTSQIQTVVTAIDAEVQNLSGLVAGFTTGVESSQAAFGRIQSATEEVVQIGQTITASSTEIAEAAGSTASYISEIAQLAERTADLTRAARQQAESMGSQAQQLLQEIQFFRLPETAIAQLAIARPTATPITQEVAIPDPINTSKSEDNNLNFAIPALAVSGATAAIALQQFDASEQFTEQSIDNSITDATNSDLSNLSIESEYVEDPFIDDQVNDQYQPDSEMLEVDDDDYLTEEVYSEFISSEPSDASEHIFDINPPETNQPMEMADPFELSDIETDDMSMEVQEEDFAANPIPDISTIEASLFADLKQEVYDQEDSEDNFLVESLDEELVDLDMEAASVDSALESVDEVTISQVTGDPMIMDATSEFMENTEFGTPAPLSPEKLANLPVSLDFSIPDLDNDEDFAIPPMEIESSLDDSSSFFVAEISENPSDDLYANAFDESLQNLDPSLLNQDFPEDVSDDFSLDATLDIDLDDQVNQNDQYFDEAVNYNLDLPEDMAAPVMQVDEFADSAGDVFADPLADPFALNFDSEAVSDDSSFDVLDMSMDYSQGDLMTDADLVEQSEYSDSEQFVQNELEDDSFVSEFDGMMLADESSDLELQDPDLQDLNDESLYNFADDALGAPVADEQDLSSLPNLSFDALEASTESLQITAEDQESSFLDELQDRLESSTFSFDLDNDADLDAPLIDESESVMIMPSLDHDLDDVISASEDADDQDLEFWQSEAIASEISDFSDLKMEDSLEGMTEIMNSLDDVESDSNILDVLDMVNEPSDEFYVPSISGLLLDNSSTAPELDSFVEDTDVMADVMDLNFLNDSSDVDVKVEMDENLPLADAMPEQMQAEISLPESNLEVVNDVFGDANDWILSLTDDEPIEADSSYSDGDHDDSILSEVFSGNAIGETSIFDAVDTDMSAFTGLEESPSFADELLNSLLDESTDVMDQGFDQIANDTDTSKILGMGNPNENADDESIFTSSVNDLDLDDDDNFDFAGLDSLLSSVSNDLPLGGQTDEVDPLELQDNQQDLPSKPSKVKELADAQSEIEDFLTSS